MLWRYGPAVVWAAAIFFSSSLSSPPAADRTPDWLSHGFAYLVLAALVCRGLVGDRGGAGLRELLAAIVITTAYGVTDELHQAAVPGRHATASDVAKDLAGAVAGSLAYGGWRARPRRGARAERRPRATGSPGGVGPIAGG